MHEYDHPSLATIHGYVLLTRRIGGYPDPATGRSFIASSKVENSVLAGATLDDVGWHFMVAFVNILLDLWSENIGRY
jgi:hypothetical protein